MHSLYQTLLNFSLLAFSVYAADEFDTFHIIGNASDLSQNLTTLRDLSSIRANASGDVEVKFLNSYGNLTVHIAEVVNTTTGNATTEILYTLHDVVSTRTLE